MNAVAKALDAATQCNGKRSREITVVGLEADAGGRMRMIHDEEKLCHCRNVWRVEFF